MGEIRIWASSSFKIPPPKYTVMFHCTRIISVWYTSQFHIGDFVQIICFHPALYCTLPTILWKFEKWSNEAQKIHNVLMSWLHNLDNIDGFVWNTYRITLANYQQKPYRGYVNSPGQFQFRPFELFILFKFISGICMWFARFCAFLLFGSARFYPGLHVKM